MGLLNPKSCSTLLATEEYELFKRRTQKHSYTWTQTHMHNMPPTYTQPFCLQVALKWRGSSEMLHECMYTHSGCTHSSIYNYREVAQNVLTLDRAFNKKAGSLIHIKSTFSRIMNVHIHKCYLFIVVFHAHKKESHCSLLISIFLNGHKNVHQYNINKVLLIMANVSYCQQVYSFQIYIC